MKQKQIKILTSIILFIVIISLTATVFALNPGEVDVNGELNDGGVMQDFGEKALGIIQLVGIVGSVLILIVAGIKYMTGSVEEKADYKKALMPYIVGAIILFTATTLANMVYQFANPKNTENGGDKTLPGRPADPFVEVDFGE